MNFSQLETKIQPTCNNSNSVGRALLVVITEVSFEWDKIRKEYFFLFSKGDNSMVIIKALFWISLSVMRIRSNFLRWWWITHFCLKWLHKKMTEDSIYCCFRNDLIMYFFGKVELAVKTSTAIISDEFFIVTCERSWSVREILIKGPL